MIELDVIRVPGGGEIVLVPESRLAKSETRAKTRIAEIRKVAKDMEGAIAKPPKGYGEEELDELRAKMRERLDEADEIQRQSDTAVNGQRAIRERFGAHIERVQYAFTPYSGGQRSDAEAEATDYSTGSPRFDRLKYNRLLAAAATGQTVEQIRALSPAREAALIEEVVMRSEPDALRLDFLF